MQRAAFDAARKTKSRDGRGSQKKSRDTRGPQKHKEPRDARLFVTSVGFDRHYSRPATRGQG